MPKKTTKAKTRTHATVRGAKRPAVPTPTVAEWVRERIRHGVFVPGQRLVEIDIVRDTGASRGKVREALQRLATEGLVTIEPFRGAHVRRLGMDEVREIYRARMVLEGLAAAECAATDLPALKQRLRKLQAQMNAAAHAGDHGQYARLNDAWHALIIEGSGNHYVAQFLSRLTVPIYRLLFSTFYNTSRIETANADHRLITAAISEGRAADAEQAMRFHIDQGLTALSEIDARLHG